VAWPPRSNSSFWELQLLAVSYDRNFNNLKLSLQSLLPLAFLAGTALAADVAAPPAMSTAPRMQVVYEAVLRNGFSIRYDHRDVLQAKTRLFFNSAPDSGFVDVPTGDIVNIQRMEVPASPPPRMAAATPAPSSKNVGDIVSSAGTRNQIDPDFLNSVIRAESNFNPAAVSRKGAQGLMQLMPQTATKLGVKNAFEPADNVDGGARYLRELLDLYNGDAAKALAAYNAGPHRVQQYGGVPPYRETHSYVAKVIRDYNRTKLAQHPELKASAKSATKPPSNSSRATKTKTSASVKSRVPAAEQTANARTSADKTVADKSAAQP